MVEASVRLGLLGLGRHGRRYALHLGRGEVGGASLAGFWRRDPALGARDARDLGARFEADLERLIADPAVDALVAVVPAGAHHQVALAVAAAGKPLLLEKPIARTVAEARAIAAAFHDAGAPLMIAQTLRFDPLVALLRARAGSLGKLRGFTLEQRLEPRGLAWEEDPEASGGGVLIQTGIHPIDALRHISAASRLEVASAVLERVHYQRNEDHAVIALRAYGGPLIGPDGAALGTITSSKIGGSRHHRFVLCFDRGGLEADLIGRTFIEVIDRERKTTAVPEQPTIVRSLEAFARLVRGGPNPIPGEDALESLAVVEAAYVRSTQ